MIAAIQTAPVHLVDRLTPWLYLVCLAILCTAALLHWRRTRHWCLLALAIGSFLATFASLATQITLAVVMGHGLDLSPIEFALRLARIWQWFMLAGIAIAAVGGIGAIHWALWPRQRPHDSHPTELAG